MWLLRSEAVPYAELHHTRGTLDIGEVPPVRSRRVDLRVGFQLLVRGRAETLRVGDVEHLHAELQLVILAPRHTERFREPHVEADVTRHSYHVPVARLARSSIAPALISVCFVAAEKARVLPVFTAGRARLDWTQAHAAALDVPVRRPKG